MPMTERVAWLRQQSLDAVSSISSERAELMTEFYQENSGLMSAPVRRALAFLYLMEHMTICLNAGELIVGEKVSGDIAENYGVIFKQLLFARRVALRQFHGRFDILAQELMRAGL